MLSDHNSFAYQGRAKSTVGSHFPFFVFLGGQFTNSLFLLLWSGLFRMWVGCGGVDGHSVLDTTSSLGGKRVLRGCPANRTTILHPTQRVERSPDFLSRTVDRTSRSVLVVAKTSTTHHHHWQTDNGGSSYLFVFASSPHTPIETSSGKPLGVVSLCSPTRTSSRERFDAAVTVSTGPKIRWLSAAPTHTHCELPVPVPTTVPYRSSY